MSLWRYLFRNRLDRDRADEIAAHLDEATAHYMREGLSEADARRKARLRFGNPRAHRERLDDRQRLPFFDAMALDLRHAVRVMRRSPAFTATAVATLAIVIGANSAVLSVADHVLVRGLPYPDSSRLALIETHREAPGLSDADVWIDGAMWRAVRDRVTLAARAAFVSGAGGVNFNLGTSAAFVQQQRVGAGFFRVLGVAPAQGREFVDDEDQPAGPRAAILSDGLWRRAFGGDAGVVGSSIMLRGEPYRVVGVMPAGFRGPTPDVDVWTPLRATTTGEGGGTNYQAVVRLNPGATWDALDAQLKAVSSAELFESMGRLPGQTAQWLSATPMQAALASAQREPIVLLTAAVATVLVIACVNIASLLLARGGARRKELATRMALGAGRRVVIRQLMVESVVLALAGGLTGLVFGWLGLEGLKSLAASTYEDWQGITMDGRVVAITMGVALLTSLLFGLVPAWQAGRIDVQRGLAEGGSRSIAGGSRHWLRRALVVTQVALGAALLVSAGLLVQTFARLSRLDPGFDGRDVTTASVSLQDARYADAARISQLFDDSISRLVATPGVVAAAVSLEMPYARLLNLGVRFAGEDRGRTANVSYVTPGFVRTLGIPLKAGRDLNSADRDGAAPVVLVNESFARLYSPERPVLGRRLKVSGSDREVVGIVGDVQQRMSFGGAGIVPGPITAMPAVYVPASQLSASFFTLVHQWFRPVWSVRATGPRMGEAITAAIAAVDPALPVADVQGIEAVRAEALAEQRLLMSLVGAVALAALLLAAMGLYGLIAHAIGERQREFGIRLALGASPLGLVGAAAAPGLALATVGAVLGGGLSVLSVRLVRSLLWGVTPGDPATYVAVLGFLLAVAALASLWPSARLLRLDPARTLRE